MSSLIMQRASKTESDPRWSLVLLRDSKADGQFFYSVKTTGIYCRPSCPSRTARPENVTFHGSREEAEQAGFRPCKRCKPDQLPISEQHVATIAKVCKYIEESETPPTLGELASYAGLSNYYFHRIFKAVTGVTPKAYANAYQTRRVRNGLDKNHSVTDAVFEAGYNSSSRFYTKSNQLLGMTPSNYQAGGKNMNIKFALGACSLGSILVASSELGICSILLGDEPDELLRELQDKFSKSNLIGGDSEYEKLIAHVVAFVEMPEIGLNLPLDIRGTAFQQRVWQALREIPAGETMSYSDIAKKIGAPKAVRAVAAACAANKIAVAIPCHRVVRNDGAISGYRWGVERKRVLLNREAKDGSD